MDPYKVYLEASRFRIVIMSYEAHVLPHEAPNLSLYSEKYSLLRLEALQQSSDAFSSTYESELALTREERLARLEQEKRIVVIVATQTGKQSWLEEEWVGQVTLIGPMTKVEYFEPFTLQESLPPNFYTFEEELPTPGEAANCYFHMTALYVDSNHRRRGIANLLCEKSFEIAAAAAAAADGYKRVDMRIIIKPNNGAVVEMYKRLGFKIALEKSTLAEAIVASGEKNNLPSSWQSDRNYNTRGGVIMVRHIG